MKKLFLGIAVILYMTAVSFAAEFNLANFGISLKGGGFNSDNTNKHNAIDVLNNIYNGSEKVYSHNTEHLNLGWDISYEHKLSNKQYLGLKIGYMAILDSSSYDVVKFVSAGNTTFVRDYDITYSAYSIPIDVYYKYQIAKKFNVSVAAGINIIYSDLYFTYRAWFDETINGQIYRTSTAYAAKEQSDSIISPAVRAGAEFLFSKYVGIFAEFGYWFSAKTEMKIENSPSLYRRFEGSFFNVGINIYPFAFKDK